MYTYIYIDPNTLTNTYQDLSICIGTDQSRSMISNIVQYLLVLLQTYENPFTKVFEQRLSQVIHILISS